MKPGGLVEVGKPGGGDPERGRWASSSQIVRPWVWRRAGHGLGSWACGVGLMV